MSSTIEITCKYCGCIFTVEEKIQVVKCPMCNKAKAVCEACIPKNECPRCRHASEAFERNKQYGYN